MNIYYVIAMQMEMVKDEVTGKKKPTEVTEERAVPAMDMGELKRICDESYITWHFHRGPFKMSEFW